MQNFENYGIIKDVKSSLPSVQSHSGVRTIRINSNNIRPNDLESINKNMPQNKDDLDNRLDNLGMGSVKESQYYYPQLT